MSLAQATIPFLKRADIRSLKKEVRNVGSAEAAERLVVDSIRKNHGKLLLQRFALLRRLDAERCAPLELFCKRAATHMSVLELRRIFEHAGPSANLLRLGLIVDAKGCAS
jgi:hypothetical protein